MTATFTASTVADATAVGTIAGHSAAFRLICHDGHTAPVAFRATVTLPLSYTDLVAALWVATRGVELTEISPDPADQFGVYALVLDAIVNDQVAVTDALAEIAALGPGDPDYPMLLAVRGLVADAFGSPDPPPTMPSPRRTHRRPATVHRSLVAVA